MAGAVGAMLCLGLGTAAGLYMRAKRRRRYELLRAEADMLCGMRLMLAEERLALGELITRCAALLPEGEAVAPLGERLRLAAEALRSEPLLGASGAYSRACEATRIAWEGAEEREALAALFGRLGMGTATMREQAAAGCLRRVKPLIDAARQQSEAGGSLCVKLCMLVGLMQGVALW